MSPTPPPDEIRAVLRRLRARALNAPAQNPLNPTDPGDEDADGEDGRVEAPDRAYELPLDLWHPIAARPDAVARPLRFIDGSFQARMVLILQDTRRRPRPAILGSVGAMVVRLEPSNGGRFTVHRGEHRTDCGLFFLADGLDRRDIDVLRGALGPAEIRVAPGSGTIGADFEDVRQDTLTLVRRRMLDLESELLAAGAEHPTVIDGLLDQRMHGFPTHDIPAVGVVKHQLKSYLHRAGQTLMWDLEPGERTPAFLMNTTRGEFVSYYLRLARGRSLLPTEGIVRVMVSRAHFEGAVGQRFAYLDGLAYWLCHLRCTDPGYARAAISLQPIVLCEERIKALLPKLGQRVGAFNRAMPLHVPDAVKVA